MIWDQISGQCVSITTPANWGGLGGGATASQRTQSKIDEGSRKFKFLILIGGFMPREIPHALVALGYIWPKGASFDKIWFIAELFHIRTGETNNNINIWLEFQIVGKRHT